MMKKAAVFTSVIALSLIVSSCSADDNGNKGKEAEEILNSDSKVSEEVIDDSAEKEDAGEDMETFTVDFINTTLSDFAKENTYRDDMIDENAVLFKQFLKDKREIGEIKQNLGGNWELVNSEVKSFSSTEVGENLYENICEFRREASVDGYEENIYFDEGYKVIVDYKDGKPKVIAAMDNSLSTGPLFPENVATLAKDLDISYFVNEDFSINNEGELPYDIEEVKDRLINSY